MTTEKNSIPYSCRLFSARESREIDSKTIEEFGISGFTLMEIAALGASQDIGAIQGKQKAGLFLCGTGNNGGDALAVARYMINKYQHAAEIWFVLGENNLSPDSKKNLGFIKKLKEHGSPIEILNKPGKKSVERFDYIVDGIFGTGLSRDVEPPLDKLFHRLNSAAVPVYSMDIPSGLDADTGNVLGACIRATKTYTFGTQKTGLYLEQASLYTGSVLFVDLPFPWYYRNNKITLLNQNLYDTLPLLNRQARHKYDGGVVHILAGSEGLTGAAIIAAKSAWKNGAGAVFLYAPKKLLPVYEISLPNIIKIPLGNSDDGFLKPEHADPIRKNIQNKPGVLLAGPGVGKAPDTQKCLAKVLQDREDFTIIDADALGLWKNISASPVQNSKWLVTPHAGEAKAYMDARFTNDSERLLFAKKLTDIHQISVLMKGNPSFLSTPNSGTFISGYDTSMFSRAGFGDYLAGAIAAQTSIRNSLTEASLSVMYKSYLTYINIENPHSFSPESLL